VLTADQKSKMAALKAKHAARWKEHAPPSEPPSD